MKNEHKLVLGLGEFLLPDKQVLAPLIHFSDMTYVTGCLINHRMLAQAYYVLRQCELLGTVNREIRDTLKMAYDVGVEKAESTNRLLQILKKEFSVIDFPYALVKGAYLSQLYPAGLRSAQDIDILMSAQHLTEMSAALKALGFQQGYIRNAQFQPAERNAVIASRMNRGETVPFIKRVSLPHLEFCEIDLNFSLDYKPSSSNALKMMLSTTRPLIQQSIQTLAPVDFMIHLCAHLYKEATIMAWVEMGRDLSLYKFVDLYFLMHTWFEPKFVAELRDRIYALFMILPCYFALYFTKQLFHIHNENLDWLLDSICPKDTAYLHQVTDPSTGEKYIYKTSILQRLFSENRLCLLHKAI